SRGEEGMALFKRGPQGVVVEEFRTAAREVFDVTGAGDTVLAACALALGAGGTLEEATVLANHAAGVVVGKIGTATVSADELARAYVGAVRELVQTLRLTGGPSLGDVLRLPGLFEVTEETPDLGGERTALRRALGAALRAFDGERRREGAHLERDMRRRTTQMR